MKTDSVGSSKRQQAIAIGINTLVGGVLGLAVGTVGHSLEWLLGGIALGAALGLGVERLFAAGHRLARWYRLRSVILVLAESLMVIYVVIPAVAAYQEVHPFRLEVTGSPADYGMAYEDVEVPTEDGLRLSAWYIPSRNGAAIVGLHGSDGNRTQLLPFARFLVEDGYGVLMLDQRGHGRSEGELFPVTSDSADVRAAVRYLLGRTDVRPDRIGGLGLSLGAHVLLQSAPVEPGLRAIICDGASNNRIEDLLPLPEEFRLLYAAAPMWWFHDRFAQLFSGRSARPFAELVTDIAPRPILFIASGTDPEPFVNRRLADLAGPGAQLWEIPDVSHVGGIFAHPDEYRRHVLDFFGQSLLSGSGAG